jgi:hypothetical protein
MAQRFRAKTLIRKPDALITIATLILSPSNLSAASSGFRVSSAMLKQLNTRRKCGLPMNLIRPQCYAVVADISYRLRNISNAIRSARSVTADLIPDAPVIIIFILNLCIRTNSYTFD